MTSLSTIVVQKALTQLGYDPGPIDGVSGERTGVALSRWKTTFEARFGTRPLVDVAANLRSIDITPTGAWGELKRAADSYDIRMAAEGPITTVGSAAGTGLVAVLAIGGVAWWLSRKARRGLRGLRRRRRR